MATPQRIETQQAKALRGTRRRFAAPGGSHDRLVSLLAKILPMGIGVIAALMIVTPLSPRGEISFLLDRTKVAIIGERLRVDNAMYRGSDTQGRPFSLTAGEAVQKSSVEGIVRLQDIVARILLRDGPASVTASAGQYDISEEIVTAPAGVQVTAADGYRMTARGVRIDLPEKALVGSGGVSGAIPAGTFSANSLRADLDARTVTLDGNARLNMVPGKLRMP
ncbi:LPS export ABC transporter periplasmic protein LptC [Parafrankia sp. BMG5.11]|uniref:LPS export ABC transporter periplasmic protein LptC n=1 Tax=Parafrankia sp. BMG5.11 TaxID=222540 RepID=UPI001038FB7B|nr:LPS export ABC transporter periplasmic protein LptC [Parafrankia sp. BMG5.11]TCJ39945.1 LPS export ABC transporter periplasmic protein LptC [Parafrankia sp. BMG5.11]